MCALSYRRIGAGEGGNARWQGGFQVKEKRSKSFELRSTRFRCAQGGEGGEGGRGGGGGTVLERVGYKEKKTRREREKKTWTRSLGRDKRSAQGTRRVTLISRGCLRHPHRRVGDTGHHLPFASLPLLLSYSSLSSSPLHRLSPSIGLYPRH